MSSNLALKNALPTQSAFDQLFSLVEKDMQAVEIDIRHRLVTSVPLIAQLSQHVITAGGKRLRPLLTIASAHIVGYQGQGQGHIGLASCVEFIHTATILHDDVVDKSELRRGRVSANKIFGNKNSVLVGDFLFSRAFELMVESNSLEILKILSHASSIIAEGEVMQMSAAKDLETTKETYLKIIGAKTAALFAAACEISAVLANAPPTEQKALHDFGYHLGMAFQLVDDLLDYDSQSDDLGKAVGNDFYEGKITLPVIYALENATAEERVLWQRCLQHRAYEETDFNRIQHIMVSHKVRERMMTKAHFYGDAAKKALGLFPSSPVLTALHNIVDFVIYRQH